MSLLSDEQRGGMGNVIHMAEQFKALADQAEAENALEAQQLAARDLAQARNQ